MKIKGKFSKKATYDYTTGSVVIPMALPAEMPREDIEAFLDTSTDKWLDISIKERGESRSLNANAMLWACLTDIRNYRNSTIDKGNPIDIWELYIEFLTNYGQYVFLEVEKDAVDALKNLYREIKVLREVELFEVLADGRHKLHRVAEVMAFVGSSQYSKAEFAQLLDGVVKYMREHGLTPPPSEEMQRALEELEKHEKRITRQ